MSQNVKTPPGFPDHIVWWGSQSSRAVACALQILTEDIQAILGDLSPVATEVAAADAALDRLCQLYSNVLDDTKGLNSFWSGAEKHVLTLKQQEYSAAFGRLTVAIKKISTNARRSEGDTVSSTHPVDLKVQFERCRGFHTAWLLRTDGLLHPGRMFDYTQFTQLTEPIGDSKIPATLLAQHACV